MLRELQSLEFWVTVIVGGLLLGFALAFGDLQVQIATVGMYATVLLGLVMAVLMKVLSIDVSMKETQEMSQRIARNPRVKKFFEETIEPLCRTFSFNDGVFLGLVEERLEVFQHELNTELSMGTASFPAEAWRVTYTDILNQPDIRRYESVAWVKSEDYWQDQAGKYSIRFNYEIIKKGMDIERIFIVRDNIWESAKMKNWIQEQRDNGIKIAVAKESRVPMEENLLIDLGIYGNRALGHQNTDEKCRTTSFKLYFDKSQIGKARRSFKKLKMHTLTPDELESYLE